MTAKSCFNDACSHDDFVMTEQPKMFYLLQ